MERPRKLSGALELLIRLLFLLLAIAAAFGLDAYLKFLWTGGLEQAVTSHALAVIGVPAASGVATVLLGVLRALDGPFVWRLPGIDAEGAAGLLIAWLLSMAGLAFAVRILW